MTRRCARNSDTARALACLVLRVHLFSTSTETISLAPMSKSPDMTACKSSGCTRPLKVHTAPASMGHGMCGMQSGVYVTLPSGSLCKPVVAATERRCNNNLRPGAGDRCAVQESDRRVDDAIGDEADLCTEVVGWEGEMSVVVAAFWQIDWVSDGNSRNGFSAVAAVVAVVLGVLRLMVHCASCELSGCRSQPGNRGAGGP